MTVVWVLLVAVAATVAGSWGWTLWRDRAGGGAGVDAAAHAGEQHRAAGTGVQEINRRSNEISGH
jgi:hypothetical protein